MQWFENAYDRAEIADYVLMSVLPQGQSPKHRQNAYTHEYHPGFYRTAWAVQPIGAAAILHYFPRRMVYNRDEGYDEPISNSFYRVQLPYLSDAGERVTAMIEFDNNFAYVKRSSEYTSPRPTRPYESAIWDEAMAALDESLMQQAAKIGRLALPAIVVASPHMQLARSPISAWHS